MAVPKRKVSRSRRGNRRSHDALDPVLLVQDKNSGELHLSHRVTPDGYYKGRAVLVKKVKAIGNAESDERQNTDD